MLNTHLKQLPINSASSSKNIKISSTVEKQHNLPPEKKIKICYVRKISSLGPSPPPPPPLCQADIREHITRSTRKKIHQNPPPIVVTVRCSRCSVPSIPPPPKFFLLDQEKSFPRVGCADCMIRAKASSGASACCCYLPRKREINNNNKVLSSRSKVVFPY